MKPSNLRAFQALARAMFGSPLSPFQKPAVIGAHLTLSSEPVRSKGLRSRRRRAAKMRAQGLVHEDGHGWIDPVC